MPSDRPRGPIPKDALGRENLQEVSVGPVKPSGGGNAKAANLVNQLRAHCLKGKRNEMCPRALLHSSTGFNFSLISFASD